MIKPRKKKAALMAAIEAANAAGELMRKHRLSAKKVNTATQHDIKLELDVRSQKLIERTLRRVFPDIPVLGEEGAAATQNSNLRWVVDPIDGTVNYAYGIPHACVSIALQQRIQLNPKRNDGFESVAGVVYDPFVDEMFTAIQGQAARLNGKKIQVGRVRMSEAIVTIGFSKDQTTMEHMLPFFNALAPRIRKVRIMGAAALALAYVACGRFHSYMESKVRIWDIAAGGLIVECAGGEFWRQPLQGVTHGYAIHANNGTLRRSIERVCGPMLREA